MSRAKYLGIAVGIARQPMALSWEEVVDGDPRVVVPSLHPIVLSGLSVDFYHDSVKTIVHIPDHTWSYQNHAMQHILQHICSSQHANQGSFYIILPLWLATRNQVTEGRFFQPNTHHTTTKPSHFGGVLSITMENPSKIHRKSLSFQWKKTKKGGCCLAPSRLDGWDPRPELRDGKVRGVHSLPTLSSRDANTNLQRCHELRRSGRNWKMPQKKGDYLVVLVFHPS